jgi:hypothetical protein
VAIFTFTSRRNHVFYCRFWHDSGLYGQRSLLEECCHLLFLVATYMDASGDGIGDVHSLMRRDYPQEIGVTPLQLTPFSFVNGNESTTAELLKTPQLNASGVAG